MPGTCSMTDMVTSEVKATTIERLTCCEDGVVGTVL